MEIEKKLTQDGFYVKPIGKLDTNTAVEFGTEINDDLDGVSNLVIDFANVDYISSMGLRVLLELQKKMKKQGSMSIKNVTLNVMEVFNITGFNKILTIL